MYKFGVRIDKHYIDNSDMFMLVVNTTDISNDLLNKINKLYLKNIVFTTIGFNVYNQPMKITADIEKWYSVLDEIECLKFECRFSDNQLKSKHIENLKYLKYLHIGGTDYSLFHKEDVSQFPIIKFLELTGWGMVEYGSGLNQWIETLSKNNCKFTFYRS